MGLRKRLAGLLRVAAYLIDRQEFISARWHKASVKGTNRYVGRTEGYIIALETELTKHAGQPKVCAMRKEHRRFDTRAMHEAGVWN